MRISDWSSDVCSSDLALRGDVPGGEPYRAHPDGYANAAELVAGLKTIAPFDISVAAYPEVHPDSDCPQRSEERRVGKECVSTCRSRWSPYHSKKTNTKFTRSSLNHNHYSQTTN